MKTYIGGNSVTSIYKNKLIYLRYLKNNPSEVADLVEKRLLNTLSNEYAITVNPNDLIYDESTYPRIDINYYNPVQKDDTDVIIPFYITDWYMRDYNLEDYSLNFQVNITCDDILHTYNMKAGDREVNLGIFEKGEHWMELEVIDLAHNISSPIICQEFMVINEEERNSLNVHNITDDELLAFNITKDLDNTATDEQLTNNRYGLTLLFEDMVAKGYQKCILPTANYRINRCSDAFFVGTDKASHPIRIPSNLTVDLNQSTIKLHPYDDREYGNKAQVANRMLAIYKATDSHLINGTMEGDFAERLTMIWTDGTNGIQGSNGEGCGCLTIRGGKFNTIENVTIKQTTGYNLDTTQAGFGGSVNRGEIVAGIKIVDGVEVEDPRYTTIKKGLMNDELLSNKYVIISVWLGYGGIKGHYWDIMFHFYDENENFIISKKGIQYRKTRIPDNAKYVATTFREVTTDELSNISYHSMDKPSYCAVNNCHWIDNRTCANPNQYQHLSFYKCDFTRSGQSITPCEIDLEDGWEAGSDFFLRDCVIYEHLGTGCLIQNCGLNVHIENCVDWTGLTFRYRILGITVRNNTNCGINNTLGYMTKHTSRLYGNNINNFPSIGVTDNDNTAYFLENPVIVKDNIFYGGISSNHINKCIYYRNEVYFTALVKNSYFKDCNITINHDSSTNYLYGNLYFNNCVFKVAENVEVTQFSFNELNGRRLFNNCTFECKSNFRNHNQFNSGMWNMCTFKETLDINLTSTSVDATPLCNGAVQFNRCTFEKNVTVNLGYYGKIQFNECTFLGEVSFTGRNDYENRYFINDYVPEEVEYIGVDEYLEYMDLDQTYQLVPRILPYSASDVTPRFSSDNTSMANIDQEGNLIFSNIGECNIVINTSNPDISITVPLKIVDVDYSTWCLYDVSTGNQTNYQFGVCNNRYLEVTGGKNITYTTPTNTYVSNTRIIEYDEDKTFIKGTQLANTNNSVTLTLDETTKYIRVSNYHSNGETKFPEMFYLATIIYND